MTDQLSERAEQLAREMGGLSPYTPDERNSIIESRTKYIIEWADSLTADSANLARGLAMEQAAQLSDEHFRKSSSPPMSIDWQRMTQAIRSLSPDAAQALAAHNEKIIAGIAVCATCGQDVSDPGFAGHRTTFCHKPCCLEDHDAKTRLDEANFILSILLPMGISAPQHEKLKKRIAALAASQPAPAKEDQ